MAFHFLNFLCRTVKGESVVMSDYPVLTEFATVCSLCNDSSIDYNEVCFLLHLIRFCPVREEHHPRSLIN